MVIKEMVNTGYTINKRTELSPKDLDDKGVQLASQNSFKNISKASSEANSEITNQEPALCHQTETGLNTQADIRRNKQFNSIFPVNTAVCGEGFDIPSSGENSKLNHTSFTSPITKPLNPPGFKFSFTAKEKARKQLALEECYSDLGIDFIPSHDFQEGATKLVMGGFGL